MQIEHMFTNEALVLYRKYMDELESELIRNKFSGSDRDNTLSDVSQQILELCELKDGQVVGTDTLKHVLNKVGSPREISDTIASENSFIDNVHEEMGEDPPMPRSIRYEQGYYYLTAEKVVKVVKKLNYVLNFLALSIIALFLWSYGWDDVYIITFFAMVAYLLTHGLYVSLWGIVDKSGQLMGNQYLLRNIIPKSSHFYFPVIIVLMSFIGLFNMWTEITIMFGILDLLLLVSLFKYYDFVDRNKEYYL